MRNLLLTLVTTFSLSGVVQAEVATQCTINLSWGHGAAGRVKADLKRMKVTGRSVYQGCGVSADGDIKYQAYQLGSNGDWMKGRGIDMLDNGGFSPVLTEKAYQSLQRSNKLSAISIPWENFDIYTDSEAEAIDELAHMFNMDHTSMKKVIQRIGFTRLTHYNWAALMKEAKDLIETKACSQGVKINFVCHSDYQGAVHGRLDNDRYQTRINGAQLKPLKETNDHGVLNNVLRDVHGQPIEYKVKTCAKSASGTEIKSIPMACHESHLVTADTIAQYTSGECGKFLDKVSAEYKTKKRLLNQNSLFDEDQGQGSSNEESGGSEQ